MLKNLHPMFCITLASLIASKNICSTEGWDQRILPLPDPLIAMVVDYAQTVQIEKNPYASIDLPEAHFHCVTLFHNIQFQAWSPFKQVWHVMTYSYYKPRCTKGKFIMKQAYLDSSFEPENRAALAQEAQKNNNQEVYNYFALDKLPAPYIYAKLIEHEHLALITQNKADIYECFNNKDRLQALLLR